MTQNEIPAGTKVKVAMTSKGVTTFCDAEVLAHMDGVVHVNVNGEAVSVNPSQIQAADMPSEGELRKICEEKTGVPAPAVDLPAIESLSNRADAIESRVTKLESDFLALQARVTTASLPSAADLDAVAAEQTIPNEQASTTPPAPAEPAGDVEIRSNPDAAADAAG